MKTTILTVSRGAAVLAGTAVLGLGASGCGLLGGGGGDQSPTAEEKTTEATTEKTTTEASTTEESTSADTTSEAAAPQPIAEADLEAAKQVVNDFFTRASGGDYAGACSLMLNPATGEPMSESESAQCGEGMKSSAEQSPIPQEAVAMTTPDKLDAKDNGDGTVTVTMREAGTDFPYPIAKAADGKMYVKPDSPV